MNSRVKLNRRALLKASRSTLIRVVPISFLLASCSTLQVPSMNVKTAVDSVGNHPAMESSLETKWTPDPWWYKFNDSKLLDVQTTVASGSFDIQTSIVKLAKAQVAIDQSKTDGIFSVSSTLTTSSSRRLDVGDSTTSANTTNTQLSLGLDVWGRNLNNVKASEREGRASAFDLSNARLLLQAQSAEAYWNISYLKARTIQAIENLEYAEATHKIAVVRKSAGEASSADLVASARSKVIAERDKSDLEYEVRNAYYVLSLLSGRSPEDYRPEVEPMLLDSTLPDIGSDLPASILQRRPDIQAAFERLQVKSSNIEDARKAFLPNITLTTGLSTSGSTLSELISNPIGSLGLSFSLPFLDWNRRSRELQQSLLSYDQAVLNYKNTVYAALKEVEQALLERQRLREEAKSNDLKLSLALEALNIAEARYGAGETGLQNLLDRQNEFREAKAAKLSTVFSQLKNASNVYKVLGGAPV
jgi:NodT family efflux transporter outer membrane factor (OMF) lipoprotein